MVTSKTVCVVKYVGRNFSVTLFRLQPGDNICNSQQEPEKVFYNVITTASVRNIINGKVFTICMCK